MRSLFGESRHVKMIVAQSFKCSIDRKMLLMVEESRTDKGVVLSEYELLLFSESWRANVDTTCLRRCRVLSEVWLQEKATSQTELCLICFLLTLHWKLRQRSHRFCLSFEPCCCVTGHANKFCWRQRKPLTDKVMAGARWRDIIREVVNMDML